MFYDGRTVLVGFLQNPDVFKPIDVSACRSVRSNERAHTPVHTVFVHICPHALSRSFVYLYWFAGIPINRPAHCCANTETTSHYHLEQNMKAVGEAFWRRHIKGATHSHLSSGTLSLSRQYAVKPRTQRLALPVNDLSALAMYYS